METKTRSLESQIIVLEECLKVLQEQDKHYSHQKDYLRQQIIQTKREIENKKVELERIEFDLIRANGKPWYPFLNESYYSIIYTGVTTNNGVWDAYNPHISKHIFIDSGFHKHNIMIGNYFKTREEAEKAFDDL